MTIGVMRILNIVEGQNTQQRLIAMHPFEASTPTPITEACMISAGVIESLIAQGWAPIVDTVRKVDGKVRCQMCELSGLI